jgi:hypothetical protein
MDSNPPSPVQDAWARDPTIRIVAADTPPVEIRHVFADDTLVLVIKRGVAGAGFEHAPRPDLTTWLVFDAGDQPVMMGDHGAQLQAPAFVSQDTPEARDYWCQEMFEGSVPDVARTRALLAAYAERRSRATEDQMRRLAALWPDIADRLSAVAALSEDGVAHARGRIGPDFRDDEGLAVHIHETAGNLLASVKRRQGVIHAEIRKRGW